MSDSRITDPRATEPLGRDHARAVVRECRITILDGDTTGITHGSSVAGGTGREHRFAASRVVIGADPAADFVVDDPAMSKFHCEIRIAEGVAVVRDLGSRNGTTVDRVRVIEAPLLDGAVLGCGRTRIRFDLGNRDVSLPVSPRDRFGSLSGASVAMRATFAVLEAAASSTTTVLLQGESGTGKDRAAESIHAESARRDGPFVVIDCGSIPASLIEVELFGAEPGAYTGATTQRIGAFEAASGGTVLLDEIGELSLDVQPKLLRAIERREIRRLGSVKPIATDVRVIAATNRDLKQEVNARRFRSDLYYRLAVLVIHVPPLRERVADLPVLVRSILDELRAGSSEIAAALSDGTLLPELLRHDWPGNVRELRNYIESSLVRNQRGEPVAVRSQPPIDASEPLAVVRERWVRHVERRYLEQLLMLHDNNVTAAAKAAGVDRVHLHRLLKSAGLR